MYLPENLPNTNTRAMVDTWRGYNHNYRISAGEFYDMENMSSDFYPLLTPRKKRAKLIEDTNIRGITLTGNSLVYLAGNTLHYGSKTYDLSPYTGNQDGKEKAEQQLLRFGAYILIFPLNIYVNLTDDADIGQMSSSYTVPQGVTITYTMCDPDGEDYENIVSGVAPPENPVDGMYWLNTSQNESGLNIWVESLSMWQPVATTYMRMEIPGANLSDYFAEGDTVTMNTGVEDINAGSTIRLIDYEYMVITGILPEGVTFSETTDAVWTVTIDRKIPELDYVCTSGNRVWGCHYGDDGHGKILNEIYASKLGDFKNWYTYDGISTDSYAVSVGEDGYWTGAISYQGRPVFFKENAIFRIYGSYPSEYQLVTSNARGVQRGSWKSLTVLNEYLVYKSAADIVIYDGSYPTSISKDLGRENLYYDAVAGATLNKYYIQMQDAMGHQFYFVYDMDTDIWEREDADITIRAFTTTESGQIFAHTGSEIYGIGANDNMLFMNTLPGEDMVHWWAETGDIGYEYPDHKRVTKIALRAYIPYNAEIQVLVSYDDHPYEEKTVLRGSGSIRTQTAEFNMMPCDHYRLKFAGHGACRIYTMTTTLETEDGL